MFRTKNLSPGRLKPGAVVGVEVRTIGENGSSKPWVLLTYMTSNDKRGGADQAEELARMLNDAFNRFHGWDDPTDRLMNEPISFAGYFASVEEKHHGPLVDDFDL